MSKKSKNASDLNGLEIRVLILRNKETQQTVRLMEATFVAQSHRYPEDKWELLRTEKISPDVYGNQQ